ncbi:conjugal transfer protein TrbM [Burkholderia multivorans]|uniref:TrbM/KikA/MpfK family conjugal transfer protein n=1 Tax=Burkholderia multivorans TaxID=87883 RepID=UPI000CFEB927|nr:TrbM/KikA/MpfK family conjugal transfer protein [Burkholderia multivorans]PRF58293.1 conjugal transfer protein TrbM [Burkholderia multivorans]
MKKKLFALAALVAALGSTAGTACAQDVLTGDTRLACEAILCLSSGTRPSECTPSLSRYFNITKRKLSDTIRARLNFLQLCPVASQTPEMQSLVSAISRGAGRCDAQSLNSTLVMWTGGYDDGRTYISNQLPDYCGAYTGHAYTDFASSGTLPRYVGTPERGGYWVEARDYDRALAEYNERIRREDEERRRQSWLN